MKIPKTWVTLKNGRQVLLRSPLPADAAAQLALRRATSEETYFMARYPEEIICDLDVTARQLGAVWDDPQEFGISAFDGETMVADARVYRLGNHIKYHHRAGFGISIRQEWCDLGLGSLMLREAIRIARENGFEQLELGVFADNLRAIHIYEKAGFQKVGVQPRAFKLKDGTYRDEIQMVLIFSYRI